MENDDKTAVHCEPATVKKGNHTLAVVDIDWHVSQINYLSLWQDMYHYLRVLNWYHAAVASPIGHPVVPFSLPLVEIPS
jgi:hypothetical protein